MKVIKAIYNFLVGDMIILVGVVIAVIVLSLINFVGSLKVLQVASAPILIVTVLAVLIATLDREARANHG